LRKLIEMLVSPDREDAMKKQVDAVELFPKSDFDKHLERHSEYACACLSCGFFDKGKTKPMQAASLLASENSLMFHPTLLSLQ
jgi:hypothetical protein